MFLFVQKSLECIVYVFISYPLIYVRELYYNYFYIIFSTIFNDVFFKKSYKTFVRSFGHEMPPIFLVVIWCKMCKFVRSNVINMHFFYLL